MLLDSPSCHKVSHFLGPTAPLRRDVLYGQPLIKKIPNCILESRVEGFWDQLARRDPQFEKPWCISTASHNAMCILSSPSTGGVLIFGTKWVIKAVHE